MFQASSAAVAASAASAVTVASLAWSSAISAESSASVSLARFRAPDIFFSNSARCADPAARSASSSFVDDSSCSRRSWILMVLPSRPSVSSALSPRSFSTAASAALSDADSLFSTSSAAFLVCESSSSSAWRLASSAASMASASASLSSEDSCLARHSAASARADAVFSSAAASCAAVLAARTACSAATSWNVGPICSPDSMSGSWTSRGSVMRAGATGSSNRVTGRTTGLGKTLSILLKSTLNLNPPTPAVRCMPVFVDGVLLVDRLSGGLPPTSDPPAAAGVESVLPGRGVISSLSRLRRLSSTVVVLMSTVKLRPNGLFARFTRGRSGRGSHLAGLGASAIEAFAAFSAAALSAASFSAAAFSAAVAAAASAAVRSASAFSSAARRCACATRFWASLRRSKISCALELICGSLSPRISTLNMGTPMLTARRLNFPSLGN